MKKTRIRFNLGQGKNFMKWKIEYPSGKTEYHVPSEIQLVMFNCTLKNFKGVAKGIFDGANKTVCAWVLCEEVTIRNKGFSRCDREQENRIRYNPRVTPNWMFKGENADGIKMEIIGSVENALYKINPNQYP